MGTGSVRNEDRLKGAVAQWIRAKVRNKMGLLCTKSGALCPKVTMLEGKTHVPRLYLYKTVDLISEGEELSLGA